LRANIALSDDPPEWCSLRMGAAMKPRKSNDPADNWVWRVDPDKPSGEWVDSSAPAAGPLRRAPPKPTTLTELPEVSTGGWLVSSFDLLNGIDVVDEGSDTVPAELFDELFPPSPSDASKAAE
jgi:hypothetical protein